MAYATRRNQIGVRSISTVLALTLISATQAAPYKSASGYSITSPAGWTMQKKGFMGSDAIFTGPPRNGFAPNIVVMVTPSQGQKLEAAMRIVPMMIKRTLTHAKVLRQGYTKLGGSRAHFIEATHEIGTPAKRVRVRSVSAIKGGNIIGFTTSSLDKDYARSAAAFSKAVASVKWTK